jgi:hypothetical protein
VTNRDWWDWHRGYDDPSSALALRLSVVQDHLGAALDACPAGKIHVVSFCAGQGRDLIGVASAHSRRDDICARLVEEDPRNVVVARESALEHNLAGIEIVSLDAGTTDAFVGAVPADIVLACGVFGNISDEDVARTVAALPSLCTPRALVIWTRHRRPPDLTPTIRGWFAEVGFAEEAFDEPRGTTFGVGVHRLVRGSRPIEPGQRLFTFVGYDRLGTQERADLPDTAPCAGKPYGR